MTKAFGKSYLLTSPMSTLTASPLTFPQRLHCSHTQAPIFSQTDDVFFHLWPPLLGQPHTPWHGRLLQSFKTQCGCHFFKAVFSIPHTGLRLSPSGSCSSPWLLIPQPLPLWNLLVHLPHQNVNTQRTRPASYSLLDMPGVGDGKYSINVCSMGEWNTQKTFSLQVNYIGMETHNINI